MGAATAGRGTSHRRGSLGRCARVPAFAAVRVRTALPTAATFPHRNCRARGGWNRGDVALLVLQAHTAENRAAR
jgi:hypothetical protein